MEIREILNQTNDVFRRVFENENINVNNETVAQDVPEWDSLNHTLMISEIEKHFGVRFKFKEVIAFKNVGDMVNTIQSKLAELGK